jgi:tetratricopeptide (TPR) repeat protein
MSSSRPKSLYQIYAGSGSRTQVTVPSRLLGGGNVQTTARVVRLGGRVRWETNTLAEELADQGRFQDAIAIYELNADFYPRSSAIAASLGRLYEELADTAAAIRSYERTLELRPNNNRVAERLRALREG